MSVEAWADNARRDKYRQDLEHQRAIDTVKLLLQGETDSDSAAGTIASIYNPLVKHGPKPSLIATLWDIVCDAVRALGGDRDFAELLVSLLNSISKLPDVIDEHGSAITSVREVYWRDLPELAIMFREYGIDIEALEDIEEGCDWDAQAVPLLNATTFGAMYLAHGRQPIGMPFHAEVSFMQGIEVSCQTPEQLRCAAMYVPPAATWVLLAGKSIYELCKIDHDYRKDGGPPTSLWGQGRGYSLDRWAFWKKRFGEIAKTQGLKDEVKDIAARASLEMEKIEGRNLPE